MGDGLIPTLNFDYGSSSGILTFFFTRGTLSSIHSLHLDLYSQILASLPTGFVVVAITLYRDDFAVTGYFSEGYTAL